MRLGDFRRRMRRDLPAGLCRQLDSLLRQQLGLAEGDLYGRSELELSQAQRERLDESCRRVQDGEPVEFLLGHCTFAGLRLWVRHGVLLPRPETEVLVHLAAELLPQGGRAVDLGTGSGAVALALAAARPDARVLGLDLCPQALSLAADNGRALGLAVRWLRGDWCAPLAAECCDLLVANPPYVAADYGGLPQLLRYEPRRALVSGADGLRDIGRIAAAAGRCLRAGGWLLLEHAGDDGKRVRGLLAEAGFVDALRGWTTLGWNVAAAAGGRAEGRARYRGRSSRE